MTEGNDGRASLCCVWEALFPVSACPSDVFLWWFPIVHTSLEGARKTHNGKRCICTHTRGGSEYAPADPDHDVTAGESVHVSTHLAVPLYVSVLCVGSMERQAAGVPSVSREFIVCVCRSGEGDGSVFVND